VASILRNQKIANNLTNSTLSHPPAGENDMNYCDNDSDICDNKMHAPLHELARRAAFKREAVGWQRFWSTYAPKFTSLDELHMRMPQCFDGVRSVELAKLLDLKEWKLMVYANEQRHAQTEGALRRRKRDDGRHEYRREEEIRSGDGS
jgi:hypothetical protein